MDSTPYGKMNRQELADELYVLSDELRRRHIELGALTQDYNNDFYPEYFRAPGNSVTAKEKEANYKCLLLVNDLAVLNSEVHALEVMITCLTTILPYASE